MLKLKRIMLIAVAAVLMCCLVGCGSNGTCTSCGKTIHGSAYGDPFDSNVRMCEDCARKFYMGFDIDNFKID